MSDDPRVQHLLDELLDSHASPEEVCRSCPELLPQVRARWREMCRVEAELDALFPPVTERSPTTATPTCGSIPLPVIPGYEVEAVLGQGGMGVVFRARHLRLNRVIALKMLLAGAYAGPAELVRFQREAEAVAGLCHANIVQIHEVGDHEGRPYFTMELVDGGSLAQKLTAQARDEGGGIRDERRKGRSSSSLIAPPSSLVRWAAELAATLAEAVAVAHRAGVIHRDLKPGNILLTADGIPKISDFGLARRLKGEGDLTWTGNPIGTPSYMAPEQASDKVGRVGPATDVYGLGAVLYEILTGRPPFRGGSALDTLRQVLSDEPAPPSRLNPRVPRDLETICLKCLQKEPLRRYTSAAALAEDLRRYLLGQVVEARPVGPLERAGKWIRRNKWVAGLSAAAVLALVAGTVVSLLFAVEARRQEGLATDRAGELERQASALEAKTRDAEAKKTEAEQARAEAERNLVSGILSPIGRNPNPLADPLNPTLPDALDPTEADVMGQLRAASPPIRLQLLETALRQPGSARRVGRRADWVMQAIVGCDRARRAEVRRLLVRRIQEPEAPQDVLLASAQLGVAANLDDRVWAERAATALSVELRDPRTERDDYPKLAEALATVSESLPPAQAAAHAARALGVFLPLLREPLGRYVAYNTLDRAIVAVSGRLDAVAASPAATAIEDLIRQSAAQPLAWPSHSQALVAVCQRLPPADAARAVNRTVDFILETRRTTEEKSHYRIHAEALGVLCGRLEADRAAPVAEAIIAILGDGKMLGSSRLDFIMDTGIAATLPAVVERLDPPGCLRATEALVVMLRKSGNILVTIEQLRTALVSLCRRLDAAGAARVSDVIVAAIRDPKTSVQVRTLFADALVALSGQLAPAQAAALENALVDSLLANMGEARSLLVGPLLARALASVGGRLGAKSTARAAEALSAAIRNPQAQLVLLKPLATALAVVSGQLHPREAASHTHQVVDVLGSLWVARTKPLERASLAEAMAALWPRLSPVEAAAHAKRVSAELQAVLRDPKTAPIELARLTEALTQVWKYLDPAERVVRANSAADTLIAVIRRPRNDIQTTGPLLQALTTLCECLDRPGVVRVAHVQIAVFNELNTERYRYAFHLIRVIGFERVAARLDERELQQLLAHPLAAGRLQRNILDVLGRLKNRSFRNTWAYLDWRRSKGT
jgi:hypothetical protein